MYTVHVDIFALLNILALSLNLICVLLTGISVCSNTTDIYYLHHIFTFAAKALSLTSENMYNI